MWTPIILVCSNVCYAFGGTATLTEEQCYQQMPHLGAFIVERFPDAEFKSWTCKEWGGDV
jgi:hypothetical protein